MKQNEMRKNPRKYFSIIFEAKSKEPMMRLSIISAVCVIFLHLLANGVSSSTSKEKVNKSSWIQPIKLSLGSLFISQKKDGDYNFPTSQYLLRDYPLIATFSRLVLDQDEDMSFASQASASCSRYVRFLLTERDKDADFLVERAPSMEAKYMEGSFEYPGFNLLLALDILNLSSLNLIMKRPVEALFWREEAKLLARRTIEATFDADSKYFFPLNERHEIRRFCYTSSLAGAYFTELLGENISKSVVKHFLLTPQYVKPESPFNTIGWKRDYSKEPGRQLLETALMLGLLSRTHLTNPESKYRKIAVDSMETIKSENSSPISAAYQSMFNDLIANSNYRDFFPRFNALDIFCALAKDKKAFSDPDIVRLQKTVNRIRLFIKESYRASNATSDHKNPNSIEELQKDIRSLFIFVSKVRSQLKERRIYNRWYDKSILGFDLVKNMLSLLDDVIEQLKQAENFVCEEKGSRYGLKIACILLNEKRVPGEKINFVIKVTTALRSIDIKSMEIISSPYTKKVLDADTYVTVYPGDTTLSFMVDFPFRTEVQNGIIQKEITVRLISEAEGKIEKHFFIGIAVEKPVDFVVNFPQGRILRSGSLPIGIRFKKNVTYGLKVGINYYSPSGLLARANSLTDIFIPSGVDTVSSRLDILIPELCRPGSFPFYVRATANGRDLGTAVCKFFKHYQWVFVGPFGGEEISLNTIYPPESRVNLLDRFRNGNSIVRWMDLPANAYSEGGKVNLKSLIPHGAIGYLYTVLKTTNERYCSVSFSSTNPAILFVNGSRVLQVDGREDGRKIFSRLSLRMGTNEVLIKIKCSSKPAVFFDLGDQEDLTADEFNNNLWELVEGYSEFHRRNEQSFSEEGESSKIVTLSYTDNYAHSVSVIGSFNGWSPESSNMRKVSPNRWEITLHLLPGKYTYRFLINNQKQLLDPRCPYQESDGYGGKNSVLYIIE